MNNEKINEFIKRHSQDVLNGKLSRDSLGIKCGISGEAVRKRWRLMNLPPLRKTTQNTKMSPEAELERDIQLEHFHKDKSQSSRKLKLAYRQIDELKGQVKLIKVAQEIHTYEIRPRDITSSSATAVVLASDFHSEERVRYDSVNGKNQFNLEIAKDRIEVFFVNLARLVNVKQKSVKLDTLVLALLGDFITGAIHAEIETLLEPEEAIVNVENLLASGIEYVLKNTNVSIIIPCHSGNHGRSTKTIHQGTEYGNSKEYLMYHFMAKHFRGEKRVKFLIAKGYHSFLDINGFVIRFHHGHFIKYGGGVGGVYISVNKAIAQFFVRFGSTKWL